MYEFTTLGAIAGIIKASALQYDVINLIDAMNLPAFVVAPLSGIIMAAASASTTAGTTIASQTFGGTLIPYENLIGLTSTVLSIVWYLI